MKIKHALRCDTMFYELLKQHVKYGWVSLALATFMANAAPAETHNTIQDAPAPTETDHDHIELCLVIALDMSASVTEQEWALQTQGLAQAFQHKAVRGAADSRDTLAVMDMVYGNGINKHHRDWHYLSNSTDALRLSQYFEKLEREAFAEHHGSTTLADAMRHAFDLVMSCPNPDAQKMIHIIGDGMDNKAEGRPTSSYGEHEMSQILHRKEIDALHSQMAAADITVNGSSFGDEGVDVYYQNYVISYHGHNFPTRSLEDMNGTMDGRDFENAIILQVVRDLSFLDPQHLSPAKSPTSHSGTFLRPVKPA